MKRFGYRGLILSLAFLVLLLGGWTGQAAAAEELVFASWGGAYQEAIRKAWLEPFSKESGIEISKKNNEKFRCPKRHGDG